MRILSTFLFSMMLCTVAQAEDVTVKNPLGIEMKADKVVNPAATSPEGVILKSIEMISAQKFDEWMNTVCHPTYCPDDERSRNSMRQYNLPAAAKSAKSCTADDGKSIIVTRKDKKDDGSITIYAFCGEKRMPAPATVTKDGDAWKISSFSW